MARIYQRLTAGRFARETNIQIYQAYEWQTDVNSQLVYEQNVRIILL